MPELFSGKFNVTHNYTKVRENFQLFLRGCILQNIVQQPCKLRFFGIGTVFFCKLYRFFRNI